MACALLSLARRTFRDTTRRNLVTELHSLHRVTYMSERTVYYQRIKLAVDNPLKHASFIMDGMSQNHCVLPWLGNLKQFSSPLLQHLLAVMEHGQEIVVYRTFHNIKNDSNLAIHCLLTQLEERMKRSPNNKLPDNVYIQIDGGAENANKEVLAFCELLVATGNFKIIRSILSSNLI